MRRAANVYFLYIFIFILFVLFSKNRSYSCFGNIIFGGVVNIKGNMEQRACDLAVYIIENRATVRDAAGKFGISKSTVHKDISERLPHFNRSVYLQVTEVLDENKAQRHIRGGMATRRKDKGA